MSPKVSIIIPCYGVEKYLDRCMNTIVNQTLKDIEIILVDDGSPDRVPEMCDEWKLKDERIKVIHKKNAGLGYARNSGLEIATGEYVAFVDSDDYVELDMYEKLFMASENGEMDVVYCGLRQEIGYNLYTTICDFPCCTVFKDDELEKVIKGFYRKDIFGKLLFMSVWHSIYKHDIIKKNNLRFFSERDILSEDLPFQTQYILYSHKVKFIPTCLYTYCMNGGSLTHSFNYSQISAAKKLQMLLKQILPQRDDYINTINIEYYNRIGWLIRKMLLYCDCRFNEKKYIVRRICNDETWKELTIREVARNSMKRFAPRLIFLKYKLPLLVILHYKFFNIFNKKTLKKIFYTNS